MPFQPAAEKPISRCDRQTEYLSQPAEIPLKGAIAAARDLLFSWCNELHAHAGAPSIPINLCPRQR